MRRNRFKPIRMEEQMDDAEFWYEIQYSKKDEDDWYASSSTADTLTVARDIGTVILDLGFDTRIRKVTVTREVVETL